MKADQRSQLTAMKACKLELMKLCKCVSILVLAANDVHIFRILQTGDFSLFKLLSACAF